MPSRLIFRVISRLGVSSPAKSITWVAMTDTAISWKGAARGRRVTLPLEESYSNLDTVINSAGTTNRVTEANVAGKSYLVEARLERSPYLVLKCFQVRWLTS